MPSQDDSVSLLDHPARRRQRPTIGRHTGWAALFAAVLIAVTLAPLPADARHDFADLGGNVHEEAIGALSDLGVLDRTECGENLFCPDEPVERWVIAVWLVRMLNTEPPPVTGNSRFADVDASRWWSPFAEQLAIREITAGCKTGPLRYCPQDPVTRAQIATFLVKAFDLPEAEAPAGFTDTAGNAHATSIDALIAAGVTTGCATDPLQYCPDEPVTRAQMATFVHRASLAPETPDSTTFQISDDVPDRDLVDVTTGEAVNLRSLVTGEQPLLLWFWSPY